MHSALQLEVIVRFTFFQRKRGYTQIIDSFIHTNNHCIQKRWVGISVCLVGKDEMKNILESDSASHFLVFGIVHHIRRVDPVLIPSDLSAFTFHSWLHVLCDDPHTFTCNFARSRPNRSYFRHCTFISTCNDLYSVAHSDMHSLLNDAPILVHLGTFPPFQSENAHTPHSRSQWAADANAVPVTVNMMAITCL